MEENTNELRAAKYKLAREVGHWPCPNCGSLLDPRYWDSPGEPHKDCAFFHENPNMPAIAEMVRTGLIGGPEDGGGPKTPVEEVWAELGIQVEKTSDGWKEYEDFFEDE